MTAEGRELRSSQRIGELARTRAGGRHECYEVDWQAALVVSRQHDWSVDAAGDAGAHSPGRSIDEIAFHIDGVADELMQEGWGEAEARSEAQRRFGDRSTVSRRCLSLGRQRAKRRERRQALAALIYDSRLALRSLLQRPGFSFTLIGTLALGLAATTAMFSLVSSTLLAPLPFEHPESLVAIWQTDRNTGTTEEAASLPDLLDYRERSLSFSAVEGFNLLAANLRVQQEGSGGGEPERAGVVLTTPGFGPMLGVQPLEGRLLTVADTTSGAEVAVISEGIRRRHFARSQEVLGRSIIIDDTPHQIVGVLPELEFPAADLWLPLRANEEDYPRYRHNIMAYGRLAAGRTVASAQDELGQIAADLETEFPRENTARGVYLEPLEEMLRGDVRMSLRLLLLSVFAVLLIACANVANLLLARGAGRRQELAVAAALGARASDLLRRFLAESLVHVAVALSIGLLLAQLLLRLLLPLLPAGVVSSGVVLDWRTYLFASGIATAVVILFTLVPILQARGFDLQSPLRAGGRDAALGSRLWFRRSMVVAQIAIALVLLAGASTLLASLRQLAMVDKGFVAKDVVRVDFLLPETRYPRDFASYPQWTEVLRFNRELEASVASLPGVEAVSIATDHPLSAGFTNSFDIVGRESDAEQGELKTRLISANYLDTHRVRILEGRGFTERDTADRPAVLLLNKVAADRLFPDTSPLGERFAFWGIEREIVGVVANERMHGVDQPAPPAMYVNLAQAPQTGAATLMVRTSGDPMSVVPQIREITQRLDPGIALFEIATMEETLARSQGSRRFLSLLLVLFAAFSLLLASLGVHAVLAYLVADRRREIGVRMALGAKHSAVLRKILAEGLAMATVGVAVGLLGALLLSRILAASLSGVLFEISPLEPSLYLAAVAVLLLSVCLACLVPARRAARIDPIVTLRAD